MRMWMDYYEDFVGCVDVGDSSVLVAVVDVVVVGDWNGYGGGDVVRPGCEDSCRHGRARRR